MGTRQNRLARRFKREPTIYILSKNKKNIENFLLKFFIFYNFKNLFILHGHVFVMFSMNFYLSRLKVCFLTVDFLSQGFDARYVALPKA